MADADRNKPPVPPIPVQQIEGPSKNLGRKKQHGIIISIMVLAELSTYQLATIHRIGFSLYYSFNQCPSSHAYTL